MNWYQIFYLFSVAEEFKLFSQWVAGIGTGGIVLSIIFFIFTQAEGGEADTKKKIRVWFWRSFIIAFFGWSLVVLVPDRKDMLMIIAGGTVGNFLTTDTSARKIPSDITKYLHKAIQVEMTEMDLPIESKKALGIATKKDELIDKVKDLTKEEMIEMLKSDTSFIKN